MPSSDISEHAECLLVVTFLLGGHLRLQVLRRHVEVWLLVHRGPRFTFAAAAVAAAAQAAAAVAACCQAAEGKQGLWDQTHADVLLVSHQFEDPLQ